MAGITLGVLVGEARTHGPHHLVTYEDLGSDQLDSFFLALVLALNDVEDYFVFFHTLNNIGVSFIFSLRSIRTGLFQDPVQNSVRGNS